MRQRPLAVGWVVRAVALLTALMGCANVLSAVTPALASRMAVLEKILPLVVRQGGHLAAALAGFALLILADGLWRRKRLAWLLALAALILSSISHLVKGLDYEEALLSAGLALWLLALRHHFHARSDPPSIRQGLRILGLAVVFTVAYGVAGFYLLDRHFSTSFGFWDALRQTIVMFTEFYDPGLQPITRFGRYFADSIYMVGAGTIGFSLIMLIRPVVVRQPATPEERERARCIVEAFGRSSLARLILLDDKSYFFSSGDSVIAYVAKGRSAIALGDPIGPPEDVAQAILGFKEHCALNDWQPAFYQVLPDYLDQYRRAGFDVLAIGNEGIVNLKTFRLEGISTKTLRTAYNHFTRLGYNARLHEPPLAGSLLAELRSISDEWLTMMHGSEKRFSLGWFDDDYIRSSRIMAVHLPAGPISAFANLIPEYQKNEATIDLMRRKREAEGGTMDFLFVALLLWTQSQGFDSFSLGLSALSGVGEKSEDPAVERALHYVYEHIHRFYNFKGLHEFKEKFHPEWSPRYLIYPGAASLPSVAMALIEADSGESSILSYLKPK